VGLVRRENQDAYGMFPELGLYLVADGVGGHVGGRVASEMVVEATHRALAAGEPGNDASGVDRRLLAAVQHAHRRVREARQDGAQPGMGSTVAAVLFDRHHGQVAICHAGDSRVYRVRAAALEQLTDDHTLVHEWVTEGKITAEDAASSPHRHIITQAVGTKETLAPSLRLERLLAGDVFVLTSDGIHDLVGPGEIADAVRAAGDDLERACARLIELANEHGGKDNSTTVVLRCHAPENTARREEKPTLPA